MLNIFKELWFEKPAELSTKYLQMGVIAMRDPLTSVLHTVVHRPAAVRPINETSRRYHGIAIRYYDPCACDAVRQIETKPFLSDRPLLYLETKRILVGEVPPLPLLDCTAPRCLCHYAHYEDRREGDRRDPHSSSFICSSSFVGWKCRSEWDRRSL